MSIFRNNSFDIHPARLSTLVPSAVHITTLSVFWIAVYPPFGGKSQKGSTVDG